MAPGKIPKVLRSKFGGDPSFSRSRKERCFGEGKSVLREA